MKQANVFHGREFVKSGLVFAETAQSLSKESAFAF
jgi:hypothetical protein